MWVRLGDVYRLPGGFDFTSMRFLPCASRCPSECLGIPEIAGFPRICEESRPIFLPFIKKSSSFFDSRPRASSRRPPSGLPLARSHPGPGFRVSSGRPCPSSTTRRGRTGSTSSSRGPGRPRASRLAPRGEGGHIETRPRGLGGTRNPGRFGGQG